MNIGEDPENKTNQNVRKIQMKEKKKMEKIKVFRDGAEAFGFFSVLWNIHDSYNLLVFQTHTCLTKLECTNCSIQQTSKGNIFSDIYGLQKVKYAY